MNNKILNSIVKEIIEAIDIPDSAYQTAENRYNDFGEWLRRDDSSCFGYGPHVFPQGSFRLGTVVRPILGEEYDLDLCCNLEEEISKSTHSQKWLKDLIGSEVENYRNFREIEKEKEEKYRCWRLHYKDQVKFHLDILPCIPEDQAIRMRMKERMIQYGSSTLFAEEVSKLTVAITDNRHNSYQDISNNWNISNPQGYAIWFESRMKQAKQFLEQRIFMEKAATIDELPVYKWKTPLQRVVQILKRHRDIMFSNALDRKPISIIISTLAARAYEGEHEIGEALGNVLTKFEELVSTQTPRVPNPVDANEDFTDKWSTEEGQRLGLESHFWNWIKQARVDFRLIQSTDEVESISVQLKEKFGVKLDALDLQKKLGIGAPSLILKPKDHEITEPAKPWKKLT